MLREWIQRSGRGGAPQIQRAPRWSWRWGLMFVVWTLIGLMFLAPTYLQYASERLVIPWSRLFSELAGWYLWALLFPAIFWAARRFPFERRVWAVRLLIHTVVGLSVSVVYACLVVLKSDFILAVATRDFRPHLFMMGPGYLFGGIQVYLLIYAASVSVVHAFDYHRKLQERELKASRLQAKLAEAQLQVLKMQLHPHFLFNTLHAISALMHKNVDAADRMIALLSDLLRLSLDSLGRQEVSLKQELDFLNRYLEIEKTRFGERLVVRTSVEPELLDVAVPNLILQPLVENAVRHGISLRSAPGEIEIRARALSAERIVLEVLDNGPGLSEGLDSPIHFGVGLSNTQARLEQLYGHGQSFDVGRADLGGLRVSLTLPRRGSEEGVEAVEEGTSPARLTTGGHP